MAYPANQITFGPLVKEYPSLAIRKAGYDIKMLTDKLIHKTFELRPVEEWGFIVPRADLEDDKLATTLSNILTSVYEPMNEFQKMHAIYTPWYNTENVNKFHKEDEGHAPPSKTKIMRYLHENADKVREVLLKE